MTLGEIDAAISTLLAAIGSGELSCRFADGRQVTYRSADDLLKQLAEMRTQRGAIIAGDATPIARPKFFIVTAVR